jgi:predicted esterase
MTSQDREVAIADNLKYVRRIVDELRPFDKLVFFGFSQGAAMAYRAAKDIGCDGLIVLGGDLPPDVTHFDAPLFLARGERDEWYSADKFEKDLKYLTERVSLTSLVFDGGHEFSDAFRENAAAFLRSL